MCTPLLALDVQIPATRKITHYYCQMQTQKIKGLRYYRYFELNKY